MNGFYIRSGKRIFDLLMALVSLPVWVALLVLIILGYIFTANWPPLFFHDRIGFQGSVFRMMKFRTLSTNADLPTEERRFAWGNFLRRSGLDELPQVIQVLSGKMSIVGPRPLPPEYQPLFNENEKLRFQVRPGITGWAQVNGRHGISWEKKFELDNYYVSHASLWLDLQILFKTIVLLLSPGEDQSLKEEKFKGH